MKDFTERRGQGKEVISKEWIVCGKVTFVRGRQGADLAGHPSSVDQVIPGWFRMLLLGEVETVIKLGIKSWFGDVGLA